jgi:hypothetical protein
MVSGSLSYREKVALALLRPLARFCLRYGVRLATLEELVRRALVQEAIKVLERSTDSVSVSRLSVATGIHRTEIARLMAVQEIVDHTPDVLNRVIGLWGRSKKYADRSNEGPRALTYEGLKSEFAALVSSVSKEVTHYPVLFELERIGAIEYSDGLVKLRVSEYSPQADVENSVRLLESDVESLVQVVHRNTLSQDRRTQDLHLRTSYDYIDSKRIPEIRGWILEQGAEFHRKMREFLSRLDRDINPELKHEGERAHVSVTCFADLGIEEPVKKLVPKKRGRKKNEKSNS